MDPRVLAVLFAVAAIRTSPADAVGAEAAVDDPSVALRAVFPDGELEEENRERRSGVLPETTADPWSLGMDGYGYAEERRPWTGKERGRGATGEGKGAKGTEGGRSGARSRGGPSKTPTKDPSYPEENGGRARQQGSRQQAPYPYQRWLQGQLLGQQMKPGTPEQLYLPAQYPRPQPPPDYQQLKGRQFRPRLQKLDAYFGRLGVLSEDCRQRLLCEVAREPAKFFPLTNVLEEEAGFTGNYQYLTSQLINTTEGARLLSYMEANFRGQDRARTCDVFQLRCHSTTEDMINFQSLVVWREMIRWLTIHVLTRIP